MVIDTVREILERELGTLRKEILAYESDEAVWKVAPGIANSAGTLALHLAGNLRHYIGAVLGGTGYVRDRDAEFSRRGVPREELLAGLDEAERAVRETLRPMGPERLAEPYPEEFRGGEVTVEFMLLHTLSHFDYHLGQVNYHRRLVA